MDAYTLKWTLGYLAIIAFKILEKRQLTIGSAPPILQGPANSGVAPSRLLNFSSSSNIEYVDSKELGFKDYKVVGSSTNHYSIQLNSNPNENYTLIKVSDLKSDKQVLRLDSIIFEEGHGCGPIYICETGMITLTTRRGIFAWPPVNEYSSLWGKPNFIDDLLIPMFSGSQIVPDSDRPQCHFGDW